MKTAKSAVITGILVFIFSCQATPDQQISSLAKSFQKEYQQILADNGSSATEPALLMPHEDNLHKLDKLIKKYDYKIQRIDTIGLAENGVSIYKKMQSDLRLLKYSYEGFYSRASGYHILPAYQAVMNDNQLNPEKKAGQLSDLLKRTTGYFQAAVKNLQQVPSADFEKAVLLNIQTVNYMQKVVPDSISKWELKPDMSEALMVQQQATMLEIKNHIAWCESNRVAFFKHRF